MTVYQVLALAEQARDEQHGRKPASIDDLKGWLGAGRQIVPVEVD